MCFSDTVDEDDDLYDFVEDEENEGDEIYEDLMRTDEQPETVSWAHTTVFLKHKGSRLWLLATWSCLDHGSCAVQKDILSLVTFVCQLCQRVTLFLREKIRGQSGKISITLCSRNCFLYLLSILQSLRFIFWHLLVVMTPGTTDPNHTELCRDKSPSAGRKLQTAASSTKGIMCKCHPAA